MLKLAFLALGRLLTACSEIILRALEDMQEINHICTSTSYCTWYLGVSILLCALSVSVLGRGGGVATL